MGRAARRRQQRRRRSWRRERAVIEKEVRSRWLKAARDEDGFIFDEQGAADQLGRRLAARQRHTRQGNFTGPTFFLRHLARCLLHLLSNDAGIVFERPPITTALKHFQLLTVQRNCQKPRCRCIMPQLRVHLTSPPAPFPNPDLPSYLFSVILLCPFILASLLSASITTKHCSRTHRHHIATITD